MHANSTVNPNNVKSMNNGNDTLSKALSQKSFDKYPTTLEQI